MRPTVKARLALPAAGLIFASVLTGCGSSGGGSGGNDVQGFCNELRKDKAAVANIAQNPQKAITLLGAIADAAPAEIKGKVEFLKTEVQKIFSGKETPQQALPKIQSTVKELKAYTKKNCPGLKFGG